MILPGVWGGDRNQTLNKDSDEEPTGRVPSMMALAGFDGSS